MSGDAQNNSESVEKDAEAPKPTGFIYGSRGFGEDERLPSPSAPSDSSPSDLGSRLIESTISRAIDVEKATPIGSTVASASANTVSISKMDFRRGVKVKPHPIDRNSLKSLPTLSTRLKQCIELFTANTVGIGWDVVAADAWIDADSQEDKKRVEEAKKRVLRELTPLSGPISLTRLMKKVKVDQETFGDGYLEIIRDITGKISRLTHVDASVMYRRDDELGWVQIRGNKQSYFVDYKSDLIVDRKTGSIAGRFVGEGDERKVTKLSLVDRRALGDTTAEEDKDSSSFSSKEEARDPIGNPAHRANEVLQFKIDNVQSQFYGMPRHTPAVPSIVGNNLAERRNVVFFDNDATPRMVVIVHGGQLNATTTANLRSFLERGHKGAGKAHRVLVLESEPNSLGAVAPQDAKIEIKPLTVGVTDDASFLKYIADNERRIRESYGIAEIFFSPITSNRATAFVSRAITNEQTFTPDRLEWEFSLNDLLWNEDQFGAKEIVFLRLISPDTTDDEIEARIHATLSSSGAVTPNDGRRRFELEPFDSEDENFEFADTPLPVWAARLAADAKGETGTATAQAGQPEPNRTESPDVRMMKGLFDPEFSHNLISALEDPAVQTRIQELLGNRDLALQEQV
jgi:capsid portal protein